MDTNNSLKRSSFDIYLDSDISDINVRILSENEKNLILLYYSDPFWFPYIDNNCNYYYQGFLCWYSMWDITRYKAIGWTVSDMLHGSEVPIFLWSNLLETQWNNYNSIM